MEQSPNGSSGWNEASRSKRLAFIAWCPLSYYSNVYAVELVSNVFEHIFDPIGFWYTQLNSQIILKHFWKCRTVWYSPKAVYSSRHSLPIPSSIAPRIYLCCPEGVLCCRSCGSVFRLFSLLDERLGKLSWAVSVFSTKSCRDEPPTWLVNTLVKYNIF